MSRIIVDPNETTVQIAHNRKTGQATISVNPICGPLELGLLLLSAAQQLINGARMKYEPEGVALDGPKIATH